MVPGLFLTTVTHFEHFLGPRCRTGAGPELGPSLVPNGPLQGAPRTTQGSPRSGFPAGWLVIRYPASGPGPVFRLAGRLSGIQLLVPVRFSGWPAGYPVSGFRSRSGFPAGRPVIRYPASGPGPVFWLAGRLSGIRLPVPLMTTVRVLCWDNYFSGTVCSNSRIPPSLPPQLERNGGRPSPGKTPLK